MTSSLRSSPTRRGLLSTILAPAFAAALFAPAADAQSPCPRAERDVIVYISDLDTPRQSWLQRQFYNLVEFGAETVARTTLTPVYRAVHVVKGSAATRGNLPVWLRFVASNTAVNAVDLVFVTHGLSGSVKFTDQTVTMATVRDDIRAGVSATLRQKLRMVFSTACYGASHRSAWLEAGFTMVSGGRRIYADSALSFPVFLTAWATGFSFQGAVDLANAADPARVQDNLAKGLLWSWGYSSWSDVDSFRLTSGATTFRIDQRRFTLPRIIVPIIR